MYFENTISLFKRLSLSVKNNYDESNSKYKNLSKFLKAPNFVIQTFNDKLMFVSNNLLKSADHLFLKKYEKFQKFLHILQSSNIDITNKKMR